jgi:hypothetical protein
MFAKHECGRGKPIVLGTLAVLTAGIAILWGWNTLAADHFGLKPIEFRHALAAEVLLIAIGGLLGLSGIVRRVAG